MQEGNLLKSPGGLCNARNFKPHLVKLSALPQHLCEPMNSVDKTTEQAADGSSTHKCFWEYIKTLTRLKAETHQIPN